MGNPEILLDSLALLLSTSKREDYRVAVSKACSDDDPRAADGTRETLFLSTVGRVLDTSQRMPLV